ncbi:MAG: PAS domain S-box protein [Planctomycetaceae bacterium]|nr:PAS domain S-box protein [Planctomycetaceae bacterium]
MTQSPLTGTAFGSVPVRIAVLYTLFGLTWIWLSDSALIWLGLGADQVFLTGALKGTVFVALTAALLYWLVRREIAVAERSEGLLRAVVSETTDAVFVKSIDGRYLLANEAASRVIGRPVADVIGRRDLELLEAPDADRVIAHDREIIAGGTAVTFEETLTLSGLERTFLSTKAPFRNADGTVGGLIGVCRDISDRKATEDALRVGIDDLTQAENALRQTEARLREAQRIARLGSWNWEPSTDRVWWSDAEYELFGLDRRSVQPSFESFLAVLHPDDRATAVERVDTMLQGADEIANDLRVIRPNGDVIWIHSRARATRDAAGKLILVEGTDQDITETMTSGLQLSAERDRFEKLMEAVPLAICSFQLSSDGTIRMPYASPHIESIYGIPPADLAQDASGVFAMIHPDDVDRTRACVEESAQTLTLWRDEFRVLNPSVGEIWVEGCSAPLRLPDGSILWHGYVNDVTNRKMMEHALRDSERRLRLALEAAGAIAFTWDIREDRVVRYFSTETALPVTEEQPGKLNGVRSQIHPDDLPGFDDRLSACLQAGTEYRNEYRVIRPDGTLTALEEYGYLDRDADGSPLFLTGIAVDVTARVAATEALRTSEARYRQLVDLLPTAIFVYADDAILYGNPAFLRMIGTNGPEDLIGRSPFEFAHPSAHDAIIRCHELCTRTGDVAPGFEMRLVRKDGRSVLVHTVAAPISGFGQPTILMAVTDLTERERATQLLRSVLSSVDDAILTIDRQGVISSANPSTLSKFGYAEDELIGKNIGMLMPEPHCREYGTYLNSYIKTGTSKVIGIGREVECCRRDGTRFPAELTVTEFSLEGERRFTGVLRDTTERQKLQAQFIQAQKMDAVGRLAGGVAHDFNNLLTVIAGHCDLLMMSDLPADDYRRDSIAMILDAGERAARLTRQLLAFSRKAVSEPRLISLNDLVSNSLRLLQRLIGEDIILISNADPRSIYVTADPGQLEQVVMNLVVNARDAMPTGGKLTIETSVVEETNAENTNSVPSRFACLSVSDTGHGIPDDIKNKIFEPFFTTRSVGKGTGLGLSVVHGVVNQHNGQIRVESFAGSGTTFRILLPLVTDASQEISPESANPAAPGTETILLVEDEEAVRQIAGISLKSQGYTVLEADGATTAMQYAETYDGEIHLLVSDVVMPEMGGWKLFEAIRQHRPGLRVLFMSGYTDDAVLRHGVVDASNAFIQKPFTPLSLARKVRETIDSPDE